MLVFMTLGQNHAHTINGKVVHKDVVAVFKNMTEAQVREMMHKDYENKYCTTYTSDTWGTHNMQYYPDGYVCVDFEQEGDELCPDCRKHFIALDMSSSCNCHNNFNPPCSHCEGGVNCCPGCGFDFSN